MTESYRCGECGELMTSRSGTIPYRESGLENVVLRNVPIWECPNGHQDVQIPAIDQLHEVLAEMVVTQPWPLQGQDVRFLRKHLGYSGREFSTVVGMNYVHLSRLENGRRGIPRKLDVLVRLFCAQALAERSKRRFPRPLIRVLEQLEATLDLQDLEVEHIELGTERLAEPKHVWQQASPASRPPGSLV